VRTAFPQHLKIVRQLIFVSRGTFLALIIHYITLWLWLYTWHGQRSCQFWASRALRSDRHITMRNAVFWRKGHITICYSRLTISCTRCL